jgi:hypothetical protein
MRTLFRTALLLTGIVLLFPTLASAQVTESLRFSAAFPFRAGHSTLPAGTYTVTPMSTAPSVVEVSNGRDFALMETDPAATPLDPTVSHGRTPAITFFEQKHGPNVLAQIWDQGEGADVASAFLGSQSWHLENETAHPAAPPLR